MLLRNDDAIDLLCLALVVQLSKLRGVDTDGLHVVKDKVDLSELGADGRSEIILDTVEDSLSSRLLRKVVPVCVFCCFFL